VKDLHFLAVPALPEMSPPHKYSLRDRRVPVLHTLDEKREAPTLNRSTILGL